MILDKYYHAPTKVSPLPLEKTQSSRKCEPNTSHLGMHASTIAVPSPPPPQGETKEGRVRLFVSFNFLPGAIWNAFSLTLAAFNIKR